jgi:phenylacetate-CoA ligase
VLDRNRRFWNEAAETKTAEQIRALQVEKIQRQLAYCYDRSPYYREKFQQIGILPQDVRTWEDFCRLPILLTPSEYKAQQEQSLAEDGHPYGRILCAPLDQVIGVASTSGTTGRPTLTPFTRKDIATTNEVLARAFWRIGIRPGDTVLHAFGLSMWVMGIPAIRALEAMGARPIAVGAEGGTERLLMFAQMTRPSALLCTPSYAEHLIERAPEVGGIHVGELGVKRLFCAGEPGAGLPAIRKKLQDAWGARVYDFAGGPWGIATISCDHDEYQGMHVICEDYCTHFDLVDPETLVPIEMTNNAVGAALLTTYDWEAGPPLKYMLNDIMQFTTDPCPCGLPGKRRKILGRADDLLIIRGINVYPAAIRNVVNSFVPRVTGEIRIVLQEPPPRISSPVHIRIEHCGGIDDSALAELGEQITNRIRDVLRFTPRIEFIDPGTLARSTHKGKLLERRY